MGEEQIRAVYCPNCFSVFTEEDLPEGSCPWCEGKQILEIIEELRELGYFRKSD